MEEIPRIELIMVSFFYIYTRDFIYVFVKLFIYIHLSFFFFFFCIDATLNWETTIPWLRKHTKLQIWLKGGKYPRPKTIPNQIT